MVAKPGVWYRYGCDDGYTGAFANTFDFGAIGVAGNEEEVAKEEEEEEEFHDQASDAADGPLDRGEFCEDLTLLESHTTEAFEERMKKTYTTRFECECLDALQEGTLSLECSMEGSESSGKAFDALELMMFDFDGGNYYRLSETSWKLETSDGAAALPNRGIFTMVNGTAASCIDSGCATCALCDDGLSIATTGCDDDDDGAP